MSKEFYLDLPMLGTDPELFLSTDTGKILPAEKVIPMVDNENKVHVDNAAIELAVQPSMCAHSLSWFVGVGLINLDTYLRKTHGYSLESKILLRPSAELGGPDDLELPSIREFGCNPSFSFDGERVSVSVPRVHPMQTLLRSIGYHIHLGASMAARKQPEFLFDMDGHVRLVQLCDLFAGIPGVILERNLTESVLGRRQVLGYGRAGEFRRQPHGFEYRTLGPWPLMSSAWNNWAHAAVRDAFYMVLNNLDAEVVKNFSMQEVGEVINNNDAKGAVKIWNKLGKVISTIMSAYGSGSNSRFGEGSTPPTYAGSIVNHPILNRFLRRLFNMLAVEDQLPFGLSGFRLGNVDGTLYNHVFVGFGRAFDSHYPTVNGIIENEKYDQI